MNLDELTLGEIRNLRTLFDNQNNSNDFLSLNEMIGKKCIVRTYSAGVWFGEVEQKTKDEVILKNARRLYYWYVKKGITLSELALYGLCNKRESRICAGVPQIWLQAIELIPATDEAIKNIEEYKNATAE